MTKQELIKLLNDLPDDILILKSDDGLLYDTFYAMKGVVEWNPEYEHWFEKHKTGEGEPKGKEAFII